MARDLKELAEGRRWERVAEQSVEKLLQPKLPVVKESGLVLVEPALSGKKTCTYEPSRDRKRGVVLFFSEGLPWGEALGRTTVDPEAATPKAATQNR